MLITVEDYNKIEPFEVTGQTVELLRGELYFAPAPKDIHQEISSNLHLILASYIRDSGKDCKIRYSPYDVYLRQDIVVQPDMMIICDLEKISESRCNGIPDLIVEILSESTKKKDMPYGKKFDIYQEFLLKEYWIVDPLDKYNITLTQYVLVGRVLELQAVYTKVDSFKPRLFSDLEIDLSELLTGKNKG